MGKGSWALTRIRKHFPKVETVADARTRIQVGVTAKDGAAAKKGNFAQCALAKACMRELKADGAIIGLAFSYLINGTKATRYMTPELVSREIVSFDRHHDFDPGMYYLDKVSPSQTLGAKQHVYKRGNGTAPRREVVSKTARVRRLDRFSKGKVA